MSKPEWEPGDDTAAPVVIDWNGTALATMLRVLKEHYEPGYRSVMSAIRRANAPSPLVVIDPEDREAVERLLRELHAQRLADPTGTVFGHTVESAQAALREFANPTPPRPDEPQGDGALIECHYDGKDGRAVRLGGSWTFYGDALRDHSPHWDDFAAVRVLSPGLVVES